MVTKLVSISDLPWQERARWKRRDLASRIPETWRLDADTITRGKHGKCIAGPFIQDLLDDKTLEITSLEAHEIVSLISSRKYTALNVTLAFCKRTSYAQQLVGRMPGVALS